MTYHTKRSVFKKTTDDWYPSYVISDRLMLVKVNFSPLLPYKDHPPQWRVSVWGGDDCGMEKDFDNPEDAWNCYIEVTGYNDVTMEKLKQLDFIQA